jgi:ribosomal protein S18 acetylase RimI-like enzyme
VEVATRLAAEEDAEALTVLDRATWTSLSSPAPLPNTSWTFFDEKTHPEDVIVGVLDDRIVGYLKLGLATPLPASDHVRCVSGLAVAPSARGRGVGRALLAAAAHEARARGARRLTLRVLGHNEAARRLYESMGFVVEGIQRGEFFLDGAYVDDVLMALELSDVDASRRGQTPQQL